jgi:murein L,D-transpeptidase YafK
MQTYPCTTGQQAGDKYVTGDLRTPEGVYFVGYKIAGGLDFKEYGGIAYTLNYPNPVDRLHGKTGHGIWIHSKGHNITPLETRGCVAISLPHITELGSLLIAGTPVVLAERVTGTLSSVQSPITARLLKNKMQQWTKAWAGRSPHMFAFYDPDAYTRAQPESFQAFRANKERLFKILPWIEIHNRDIYVLEGPDYWVTWADQYYRAPNLSTEGVRRLYWQRDNKGEFRIVGMEWEPKELGMRADILKGALARAPENAMSDAALPPDADEARPVGVSEATQTRPILPDEVTAPERPALAVPPQILVAAAPLPASAPPAQPQAVSGLAAPRADSPPDHEVLPLLQRRMGEWIQAFRDRSPALFAFYEPSVYGRQFGEKQSFRAFKAEQERLFHSSPWFHVQSRPVTVEKQGDHWVTSCALLTRDTLRSEEGIRRLYWQQGTDGQFRIVGSAWIPQPELALQADYLESITPQVSAMIEDWRQAWESGNIDVYAEFYLPRARQGTRYGPGIFQYKSLVWAKAEPEKVELSGMRIQLEKGGLKVDMAQSYSDSAGYQDKGVKTLVLTPQGDTWRIAAEDWAPQPPPQP